jgi:hypothetical protein
MKTCERRPFFCPHCNEMTCHPEFKEHVEKHVTDGHFHVDYDELLRVGRWNECKFLKIDKTDGDDLIVMCDNLIVQDNTLSIRVTPFDFSVRGPNDVLNYRAIVRLEGTQLPASMTMNRAYLRRWTGDAEEHAGKAIALMENIHDAVRMLRVERGGDWLHDLKLNISIVPCSLDYGGATSITHSA